MNALKISSNFSSDPLSTTDNQTEIVYTVFVNGIPVLATIAANDMKLMSEAEVSELLEKTVFTKAERMLNGYFFQIFIEMLCL